MRSVLRLYAVLKTLFAALLLFVLKFELMHTASLCPQDSIIQPCKCSERSNEVQIWCSYGDLNSISNALRSISQFVSKEIDELILENNLLPSLPGQMFSSIKVLRLMLRENGLQRVSSNWLAGLENSLQEIYLVEPELKSFPDDSLITLPKLEALTLSASSITKMPAIFGLSRLRYIQIEASSLTDVYPNNFQGLPLLEQLHITSAPKIKRLNEDFIHDLPRLSILNFTQCGLSYIHPRAFTRLPALTELSFTGNKFTDARLVGMAIRDLQNLATLRLDRNIIHRLEEATFVDIPSLRNLYLNDNKIGVIFRAAFHRLPRLRSLDLSNNVIHMIHPESFLPARENSVEELWLNNNQIEHAFTLRLLLDSLPNLRLLDMSNNYMEELSYGIVQGHSQLEMLILENNRIKRIGRESFINLPSLRELKLRNNSISYQIGTPYWNLPALKGLDLSMNSFEHVDRFLLNGLPSLRRFDMSHNSLKAVEPASFVGNPFLEHVNVSKNDLNTLSPLTFGHLQRLFDLDVSYNNLSHVVSGIPKNIEYLYIAGNNIMVIPTSVMHEFQLSALKLLDLSGNKIHKVPATSFSSLCTLRTLLLNDNSLQIIDQSTFENLPQLRVLNLAYNKIISINKDAFKKLKHLSELNLRRNRLEIFEPSLLSQNSELRKFDISGNILTDVPSNAFAANKKIEELIMSENSLTEFPSAISAIPSLQMLDLSRNQMTALPTNVLPSLPSLREIHLSGNKLQSLSQGVFNKLQNLSILDLENNEIEQIAPHTLNNLPSLVMAKISNNKISSIASSAFADLPALQSVDLQQNHLIDVASDAFTACPNLLMLNLSNNLLTSMGKAGLNGIKTLEALDLSNNKISHLDVDNVRDLNFLVLLKMDNNRLCNIEGTPFEKMSRLRMLSLRDNKMTTLTESTFSKLRSSILYFDIEGNPVKCSCNMLWLHSWLQRDDQHHPGPRCSDGILLRDHRMSKHNCEELTEFVPGCESSSSFTHPTGNTVHVLVPTITTSPTNTSSLAAAQVIPSTKPNSYLKPLPEETDYFDPKFIDYHENNSKTTPQNGSIPPEVLSHFIPGDTPTIYAGGRKKSNGTQSPTMNPNQGTSFTFFGMPIPSLNLDNFWNSGKSIEKQKKDGRRESWPPSEPEIQKDGFVPILPGEGGFVPMNISTTPKNHTVFSHHVSGHATISKVSLPTSTQRGEPIEEEFYDNEAPSRIHRNVTHRDPLLETIPKPGFVPVSTTNATRTESRRYSTTEVPKPTFISEPIFSGEVHDDSFSDRISDVTTKPSDSNDTVFREKSDNSFRPSPLSEFLVPGGQLSPDTHQPTGKSTISKVQLVSGPSPQHEDVHTSHLRLAKSSLQSTTTVSTDVNMKKNESMSWYYTNYNRSNIEPYVGRLPIKYSSSDQNHVTLPLFLINGFLLFFIF